MKIFISRLIKFLSLVIAANILLVIFIVYLNSLGVSDCDLANDVNTVIIGDSHTMWSIDASNVDKVRNVSLNAEGYVYTYHKLKHLLDTEPNISHVYLGFGYHNLSGYYDDFIFGSQFKNLIHRYLGVMELNDFMRVLLNNPDDLLVVFKNILQRGIRSGLKQECTLYGSFPDDKKLAELNLDQMRKRIQEQFYENGEVISVSESNIKYLNKIIALILNKQIKLTILNTPLHHKYIESIPEKYVSLYHEFISRNQLELYDFKDMALPDSYFLPDADHVNYNGALLTTEKFKEYHESNNK